MTSVLGSALRPVVRLLDRLRGRREDTPPGRRDGPLPPALADDPAVQPYEGGSGPVGVLLIHGFTGTPQSLRPWAEHLEADGFTVSLPRLPGHGTHWRELNQTAWTDWYAHADAAFADLRDRCDQVFIAALSMGGALGLRLAEQHGAAVAGLVLVNPAINITDPRMRILPVLHHLVPSLAAIGNDVSDPAAREIAYDRNPLHALHSQTKLWADVVAHLDRVTQPLLVFRSDADHVVDPSSVALLKDRVGSADAEFRRLTRSFHVATLDYEAAEIFSASSSFFRRLSA
ncbi:alpha/beta hydrolase [Microlunatus aurantiacus]|uniref:alpha/beta hydrolase n=1 Tax=Microlunatus aurantiacus TaxID=446786 RepID=UPI0031E08191